MSTLSSVCLLAGDIFVPVLIEENDILGGISKVLKVIRPYWPTENIHFKTFTDGITNKLIACQLKEEPDTRSTNVDIVLVRIYGNKTDLLIDRTAEIRYILEGSYSCSGVLMG